MRGQKSRFHALWSKKNKSVKWADDAACFVVFFLEKFGKKAAGSRVWLISGLKKLSLNFETQFPTR